MQLLMTDVTGEAFPALMRRLVLDPLGMTASTYEQPLPAARAAHAPVALLCALVLIVALIRVPGQNLRQDDTARQYIEHATAVMTPDSLLVTGTDAHTFALWYAAWGTGELLAASPGVVLVNIELYEQDWYRRLLQARYSHLEGIGAPFADFIEQNARERAVWLTEPFAERLPGETRAEGVLWAYWPVSKVARDPAMTDVARLAGVPKEVIDRAGVILDTLDSDHRAAQGKPTIPARRKQSSRQLTLFEPELHPLLDEL
jgi:CubicO group peptidase (beta-lactamase class C family)